MTKLDPSRTPCEEAFTLAISHAAWAGACRIVSRHPETDPASTRTLNRTADDHSGKARWFLSCLAEIKPRRAGEDPAEAV
ncbi:hypothetical protein [Caulobacter sp. DWP3-1-3b2]|uniref:hypothetical protein n=1 Tax=Caulobacter sp. DWP3-1-3b2 TaxID=2804643 RepID=UPI003CF392D3